MTATTSSPPPEPGEDQPRPDLQVVREPTAPESTQDPADLGEDTIDAEHQDDDNDGDIEAEPLLDSNGDPVTPQAPLDVQIREHAVRYLHGLPAFGQRPASFAEAIEYSQTGDWATSEKGAKRALHGMATVITFVVTYPLVDLLGNARTKPGPFAVALLIAIAASSVLALVL